METIDKNKCLWTIAIANCCYGSLESMCNNNSGHNSNAVFKLMNRVMSW